VTIGTPTKTLATVVEIDERNKRQLSTNMKAIIVYNEGSNCVGIRTLTPTYILESNRYFVGWGDDRNPNKIVSDSQEDK